MLGLVGNGKKGICYVEVPGCLQDKQLRMKLNALHQSIVMGKGPFWVSLHNHYRYVKLDFY